MALFSNKVHRMKIVWTFFYLEIKSGRGCLDLPVIIFIRIRYHKELLLIDRLTFRTKGNIRKEIVSLELKIVSMFLPTCSLFASLSLFFLRGRLYNKNCKQIFLKFTMNVLISLSKNRIPVWVYREMAIEKFLYLSSLGWLLQEYNFWMGRGQSH